MADTLDKEIARINKMRLPAGQRSDMVKRARSTWDCPFVARIVEPGAWAAIPRLGEPTLWCGLCGYHRDDHRLARCVAQMGGG